MSNMAALSVKRATVPLLSFCDQTRIVFLFFNCVFYSLWLHEKVYKGEKNLDRRTFIFLDINDSNFRFKSHREVRDNVKLSISPHFFKIG